MMLRTRTRRERRRRRRRRLAETMRPRPRRLLRLRHLEALLGASTGLCLACMGPSRPRRLSLGRM
jgi:hypothetical protein